ncbi:MAG TPA: hypothetical protein VMZ69_00055 [Saprospiraceae bacterium]|nr:hypothetical protein [Saprospiraceae bacterium]
MLNRIFVSAANPSKSGKIVSTMGEKVEQVEKTFKDLGDSCILSV